MSADPIQPSTLAGIKRLAKTIKRERGISHAEALDAAAKAGGFQNFRNARNVLEPRASLTLPKALPTPVPQIETVGGTPPARSAPRRAFHLTYAENLRRRIESTEHSLDAMRAGRIKGMGYGPGSSDPQSVAIEIRRLERNLEEDRALLRMDRAKERLEEAHQAVFKDLLPHGNGTPSLEAVAALDVANENFKAAKAKFDRLAHQLLDKPH